MSSVLRPAVCAALVALGVAACGGSSSTSSSAAGGSSSTSASTSSSATSSSSAAGQASSGSLSIAAQPSGQLAFSKKQLTAKAGRVTIAFTNMAPEMHNLTLQKGTSGAVVGSTPTFNGSTKTLSVKLAPGTYTFYCSVPGHRAGGMQGTLTVTG